MQRYSYLLYGICDGLDSKYVEINSVNPLYLIFSKVNRYFEEINNSKYLTLVPTNESKKKLKTMQNYQRFNWINN